MGLGGGATVVGCNVTGLLGPLLLPSTPPLAAEVGRDNAVVVVADDDDLLFRVVVTLLGDKVAREVPEVWGRDDMLLLSC